MPATTLFKALREKENKEVADKLQFYSILMAVVPIITFFVLRDAAFSGAANADMWAGFGAVGAANVVVVAYVVMVRQQFCGDDVSLKKKMCR